jgi:hypothetical protein
VGGESEADGGGVCVGLGVGYAKVGASDLTGLTAEVTGGGAVDVRAAMQEGRWRQGEAPLKWAEGFGGGDQMDIHGVKGSRAGRLPQTKRKAPAEGRGGLSGLWRVGAVTWS